MRRLVSALVTTTVACGLVGLVPSSAAADTCADPDHPFTALPLESDDLVVGIAGEQVLRFTVEGPDSCYTSGASVRITTPRQQAALVPLDQEGEWVPGRYSFSGVFVVDPVLLRNPDAGTWQIAYEVDGEVEARTTVRVRRATRLAFDAGPEPVRKRRVTFRGGLERADWEWRAWRAYRGKRVTVSRLGPADGGTAVVVATDRTSPRGRYTVTMRFPGDDRYQASYAGGANAAPSLSRVDTVRRAR